MHRNYNWIVSVNALLSRFEGQFYNEILIKRNLEILCELSNFVFLTERLMIAAQEPFQVFNQKETQLGKKALFEISRKHPRE